MRYRFVRFIRLAFASAFRRWMFFRCFLRTLRSLSRPRAMRHPLPLSWRALCRPLLAGQWRATNPFRQWQRTP